MSVPSLSSHRHGRPVGFATAALLLLSMLWTLPPSAVAQSLSDTTSISFDEAIRIALEQNTDLKRAANSVDAANATIWAERMDFAPTLTLSVGGTRSFGRSFSQEEGGLVNESTDFLTGDINGQLTLFDGFANVASLRQANLQGASSELSLERTRQDVVFRVMDRYLTLVESREILRVQREELEARRQQLRQIEEFVDAGSRPVSALYEQQAAVAEQESAVLQGERDVQLTETRLMQVLQLDPFQDYRFEAPTLEDDTLATDRPYQLRQLLQEAEERRLDVRAARADVRAAEQSVRVARSSYYPTLTLQGTYGSDWSSQIGDTRQILTTQQVTGVTEEGIPVQEIAVIDVQQEPIDFFDKIDDRRGGSIGLRLSFPLFDGLRRDQRIEQAQVQRQDAEYALDDQKLLVSLQVREAYLNYQNATKQLEATSKRLRAARQARQAAQERYNLGAASIVELTTANRNFVEAASQRIRARYNFIFQQKLIDYYVGTLNPQASLFE